MKMKLLASILVFMTLAGLGCVQTSDLSDEEAANALTLMQTTEIVIRPTVFGVGGALVEWLGKEGDEWNVNLTEWTASSSVSISWSVTSELETEASKTARSAYDQEYSQTPIGVEIPDPPKVEYQDSVSSGSLSSSTLASAQRITLPEYWAEGDAGTQDSSLIWLSSQQYEDLVNTRKASISLGLFDEYVITAENAADQMQSLVEQFKGLFPGSDEQVSDAQDTADTLLDITTVEAEGEWGTYTLSVNDVRTKVRTIEAENKFATYTILANPENPIILEIKLSPLAQGTVQAFNPSNIASSFSGFEIVEINVQKSDTET
jgi:hypothetical protein